MAARPDHSSVTEARSVSVSYWKDGLCDASESKAVSQLLRKCEFHASSGENISFNVLRERAASASLIRCGNHSVRWCVLQKRAILVFVALDSGGAFQTEEVFALVELCRELGTPFLFVQEEVCVREVLCADKKQPIVFCLTSVLAEDEDILRSLQDLAAIKRNKVLGEFFQSVNVIINTSVLKQQILRTWR
jgi:ribosomal protein L7Ae-like RNA K-turn-binding protein